MKRIVSGLIRFLLRPFGLDVTRQSELEKLKAGKPAAFDMAMLLSMPAEHATLFVQCLPDSKSQLRQDLFVLSQLDFRQNGYFVEFGATNGLELSNTYLLEKRFGWKGILAEPALCWREALRHNRSAHIENDCVWKVSGASLTFNEVSAAEFSTITNYSGSDHHKATRQTGKTYNVHTISLNDLLVKYDAPRHMDYLSIDTEGSEFEILNSLDFDKYSFGVITCEHNYTPMREKIFALLTGHGYTRKFQSLSQFDDWYVKSA